LPPTELSRRELSNFYANSGSVLLSLHRNDEAIDALVRGEGISPDDPVIHRTLALLYGARQQSGDAEQEYETALSLRKDLAVSWFDLGEFYFFQRRFVDARPLVLTAAQLTLSPVREYLLLGYIDLALHQAEPALLDFSKAEEAILVYWEGQQNVDPDFYAEIAEGRAQAYLASGEQQRAIESQLEAIRKTPEVVSRWQALASIYEAAGRQDLAEQARQKAQALSR
jgi:tetratricopeptide (TPR) repeat protein